MKKTVSASAALAVGLILAGCGGPASVHHTLATKTACQDLAHWENSSSATSLQDDPISTKIIRESSGTQFGADFAGWVQALKGRDGTSPATSAKVASDCSRAGVPGVLNGGLPAGKPGTVSTICKDIDYWYNFGKNSAIPGLMEESAGTRVGTDFAAWIKIWNGPNTNAINAAAARLATDCAKAGVTSLQTDLGTGGGSTGTPQPSSSPKPTPTRAPKMQTVTYVVNGSAADVTYGPAGSDLQGTVPMSVTDSLGSPAYYAITAQLQGEGAVSCAIEVNGETISSASATGGYNIASCEISQDPLSGQWANTNG
jgi:hypothetical protein